MNVHVPGQDIDSGVSSRSSIFISISGERGLMSTGLTRRLWIWLGDVVDDGCLVRMVRRNLGSVDLVRHRWSLGDGESWIRTLTLRARA